jgi:tRNA pseudouridine55 synthase
MGYLSHGEKTYIGTVHFGFSTDTDDRTGKILRTKSPSFSALELASALQEFQGEILQRPPTVSALKVAGKRAYALYRDEGETPALAPRQVVIHEISLLEASSERARLRVRCGGGTYIRALARDLGERLGCPAHLHSLRRERVGPLTLEKAVGPESFRNGFVDDPRHGVFSPLQAVGDWPRLVLDAQQVRHVRHGGQPLSQWWGAAREEEAASEGCLEESSSGLEAAPRRTALLDEAGELVALAEFQDVGPRLLMVLPEDSREDL